MSEDIFVFGSNLAGVHGSGAAKCALDHHGAIYGIGVGPQGNSYGIPTKDENIKTMKTLDISLHVAAFLNYARKYPELRFYVTRIGCGLAGYTPEQIAPMFNGAPKNCILPVDFEDVLKRVFGT